MERLWNVAAGRFRVMSGLLILMACATSPVSLAQEPPPAPAPAQEPGDLGGPGESGKSDLLDDSRQDDTLAALPAEAQAALDAAWDITFEEEKLPVALVRLFQPTGVSVLVSPTVTGTLSAVFHGVPLRTLLSAVFREHRLRLRAGEEGIFAIVQVPLPPGSGPSDGSDLETTAMAPATDAEFQIRLMAEPQDREHVETDYIAVATAQGTVHLPMRREVLCTEADVAGAELTEVTDGQPLVAVRFKEPAADRLRHTTSNSLGKQLAVIFRGELVAAPTIRDILDREIQFTGMGANWPERARQMVDRLNEPRP